MSKTQSFAPKEISKYIREQMTDLLHVNDIYQLDSYGWIDADNHDPDLVGHTMRQTDNLSLRLLDQENPPPLLPPPEISGGGRRRFCRFS